MRARPFVLLSAAVSVDGCLDDTAAERLVLSDAADLDRVDAERAASDAILVGAGTVRADDPRLRVRAAARVAARVASGRPPQPLRVVLTGRGELDPAARVFAADPRAGSAADDRRAGSAGLGVPPAPSVLVWSARPGRTRGELAGRTAATVDVVDAGDPLDLPRLLVDLSARGVDRLMVEGGGAVHTAFLAAGLVDEIQLLVAPFLLGARGGARFAGPAAFPQGPARPMRLLGARPIGDQVLLRYRPDGAR